MTGITYEEQNGFIVIELHRDAVADDDNSKNLDSTPVYGEKKSR
jgi:hypothetical protein